MRKLTYYVGMTLDGRIAGPDGDIDFFPLGEIMGWISENYPETLPVHVRRHIGLDAAPKRFDTILMGRVTYQPGLDLGITSTYAPLRHYIVSSTLDPVDDDLVTVVRDDVPALVRRLKAEDGADLYLAGGGTLAGSLLSEIDRLVIKLYPIVANAGVPVFTGEFSPTAFTLTGSETLADGVTILTYDRA